jgi:hypothetical protein
MAVERFPFMVESKPRLGGVAFLHPFSRCGSRSLTSNHLRVQVTMRCVHRALSFVHVQLAMQEARESPISLYWVCSCWPPDTRQPGRGQAASRRDLV